MDGFRDCFSGVEDPYAGNARWHDLLERLVIALCAVLCGGENCVDMADVAEEKEAFPSGIPGFGEWLAVARHVQPGVPRTATPAVAAVLSGLHGALCRDLQGRHRDRKQGSAPVVDTASAKSALHMVSAWDSKQ